MLILNQRGVRGFQLNSGNFSEWKVQGKQGGYTQYVNYILHNKIWPSNWRTGHRWIFSSYTHISYPDKTRGVLNEGGLYGERSGWHLPGFVTRDWEKRAISEALPDNKAGVGFFVTTFNLSIPTGLDVGLSFNFDGGSTATFQPYRALLFVNGWMMGKRVGNLGYAFTFLSSIPSKLLIIFNYLSALRRNSRFIKAYSIIKERSAYYPFTLV